MSSSTSSSRRSKDGLGSVTRRRCCRTTSTFSCDIAAQYLAKDLHESEPPGGQSLPLVLATRGRPRHRGNPMQRPEKWLDAANLSASLRVSQGIKGEGTKPPYGCSEPGVRERSSRLGGMNGSALLPQPGGFEGF